MSSSDCQPCSPCPRCGLKRPAGWFVRPALLLSRRNGSGHPCRAPPLSWCPPQTTPLSSRRTIIERRRTVSRLSAISLTSGRTGHSLHSMSTCDRVPDPAQILRQVLFHLHRRLERHRVQVLVEFRQEAEAVTLHQRGILDPCLVIGEAFLRRQAGH